MRVPALIRSGWWVAVAALVITVATAWFVISSVGSRPEGTIPEPDFAIDRAAVPADLVVRAMARDGVQVVTGPATLTPAEIDRLNDERRGKLLVSSDRVIGVEVNGVARAYPLRLMRWHEVVNDVVGGVPIAVTYNPLCDSVAVYHRTVGDEVVELGVSGYLYNSNPLLYDRRLEAAASPLWQQLTGEVVAEPDPSFSAPLEAMVETLTTWGDWRDRHGETLVMAPLVVLERLYKRDPYHSYFGSDLLHFPVRPLPPGPLHLKDRIVILTIDEKDKALALRDLASLAGRDTGRVELEVGGVPLRIEFRVAPGTAKVEELGEAERLQAVRHSFWFAWYSLGGMIPDTDEFPESDHSLESPIPSPGGA